MSNTPARAWKIGLAGSVAAIIAALVPAASQALQPVSQMPARAAPVLPGMAGIWQAEIAGSAFRLKGNYQVEIKMAPAKRGMPDGLVTYFIGRPDRPSTICRSQLNLKSQGEQVVSFTETLNYKYGKDACPIFGDVTAEAVEGQLLVRWITPSKTKPKLRMETRAVRIGGGVECRRVGENSSLAGKRVCRDVEGNWSVVPD